MKKLTFILSISLTLCVFGQVPNYVSTNGLVGWWPFNGNANDESGNGNNGTVNGAVSLTTDREGNQNAAYSFPGSSSAYINITQNSSFSNFTNGFSLSVWYLSNAATSSGRIVALGNTDACNLGFDAKGFSSTGIVIMTNCNAQFGEWGNAISNQDPSLWYNLILTANFANNSWTIYHNGNEVLSSSATSSISTPLNLTGYPFNFGRKAVGAFDPWNGKIDDIGIWNRALTPQEVAALYNGCQQTIAVQPQSQTVNFNDNVQFTASSSDANATYQWQTNLGLGFQNLTDAGQYSGSATNTLSISNVTLSNNNQQFRCIINSGSCSDTSSVAILTVVDNVGIEEQNQLQLLVYPNPTSSTLTIENPQGLISNFVVVDASGREVLSGKLEGETNSISIAHLSIGKYIITFEQKAIKEIKFIKE